MSEQPFNGNANKPGEAQQKNEVSNLVLHDKEMRDIAEPYEFPGAGPKWFYLFVVVSLVIAAFYLGRHMGKLDASAHIGFLEKGAQTVAAEASSPAAAAPAGDTIFTGKCASCHQATGQGVPGVFPPLVKSEYVLGNPDRLISIILRGLSGPVEVEGATYNGMMPAWAGQMNDQEVLAVINYIRTRLGENKAEEIKLEDVSRVRKETDGRAEPWTAEALKAEYS